VSWRVRSTQVGKVKVEAELAGYKSGQQVNVTERSLFD
jgi:hypothetical protein